MTGPGPVRTFRADDPALRRAPVRVAAADPPEDPPSDPLTPLSSRPS
jgi:hypothetical protein